MSVYTVHEPPLRDSGASADPERFAFVRDGFYFWAFIFGPLWLLWRCLWFALFLYVVAWIVVEGALWYFKAGFGVQTAVNMAFALLLGMEASSLWRWTLNGRGWKNLGVVVGDDLESAERRFFQTWREQPQAASPSKSSALTNYGPKAGDGGSDVIGLFPEPGGPR
ncbi:MAG: DUF2628 domain-containing protein [Pseudorhodoplanes sp.]|nr:DUF2628 domain-containing protein [Pseudorhodoplanes sp.]